MKFFSQTGINVVKAYFKRNWKREDLTNKGKILVDAHIRLKKIYLTLFCALLSSTIGSFFHLIWDVGGLFTVLTAAGTIFVLFTTSILLVRRRVLLLMTVAYFIGASVGLFTRYLFGIDQGVVFSYLVSITISFGTFWLGSMLTRRRSLYGRCLLVSDILMLVWLLIASDIFGGHTARWILLVYFVLVCYTGYFVVYSKEVMYDARFGDVDFVDRAFTHLFHLPAILGHYIPLRLAAVTENYKQKKL
ncbi:bax inhibitor 1-like [Capsicum galapagoense]